MFSGIVCFGIIPCKITYIILASCYEIDYRGCQNAPAAEANISFVIKFLAVNLLFLFSLRLTVSGTQCGTQDITVKSLFH